MKGYTYDKSLSEKESQILSFVYSGNEHYLNAFNFVHKFYRINYRLHKSNHLAVFFSLPFFALPFFGNTKLLLNIKIVFMKGYTYDK